MEIPEGELFFGELNFKAAAEEKSGCVQLVYKPFHYLESRSPAFKRFENDAPINCFGPTEFEPFLFTSSIPKDCFNGAAPDVIQDFPTYRAQYTTVRASESIEFSVPSANSKRRGTNRYTVNDLPGSMRDSSIGGYIGGSMQDWEFLCRDTYAEVVRQIVVRISDVDRPPGLDGSDHFSEWPQN